MNRLIEIARKYSKEKRWQNAGEMNVNTLKERYSG